VEKAMIEFTIEAPVGSLVTWPIGRVPGGYRVQIDWAGQGQPEVTFQGISRYGDPPCAARRISGKIINGSDWALIRDDGVVTFNAKLTFEADDPDPPAPLADAVKHVFDAVLSGTMELPKGPKITRADQVREIEADLEVYLPIRFETSIAAPICASPELVKASKHAKVFAELSRRQFVAYGRISLKKGDECAADLKVAAIQDIIAERERAIAERDISRQSLAQLEPSRANAEAAVDSSEPEPQVRTRSGFEGQVPNDGSEAEAGNGNR
jgi:hypothetical protein